MFEVGDKVVCIADIDNLSYGQVYQVLNTDMWDDRAVVQVIDDVDEECWYYVTRFASVIIKNPDPMVTIPESEYHSLIEEVNMLQELVAELSSPKDADQVKQAETYRELQMLLVAHPSFQDGAGENTIHEELVNTVMELQSAWDRLASVSK